MNERGTAPLELALGVALILIPVVLAVLSFGPWMERRTFVRVAASETARAVVTTGGDEQAAVARLAEMAANNRIDAEDLRVGLCGAPALPLGEIMYGNCVPLERGAIVSARVEVSVPGIWTPFGVVGDLMAGFEHLEAVDVYRSLP